MNAAAIRVLFDYNAWAHAQVIQCINEIDEDQFTQDTGYSMGSLRDHLVHIVSVDARWFSRVRGNRLPDRLNPADFPMREDVMRLWSVVYTDLGLALASLTDARVAENITYTSRGVEHTHPVWRILLHVVNHGTDHRAQMLYALHKMGVKTPDQDFAYYLRDELPPRGMIEIDKDIIVQLFQYDAYATSRLVAESLADLTDADLDHEFGYSHGTVRGQLAHLLVSTQYWLERAFQTDIPGELSALMGAGISLTSELDEDALLDPIEYRTGGGIQTANLRWEMLWNLVNHGTDHRAQTLAFLHEVGAETFEQDMIIYFWDYHIDD